MSNLDNERRSTMQKYTQSQSQVADLNVSIKELELNLEKSSDNMKSKYQEVLTAKQLELTGATLTLDTHYKRLGYLNTEEGANEFESDTIPENFPHAHVKRSTLNDEDKIHILKTYGKKAYLSMPA